MVRYVFAACIVAVSPKMGERVAMGTFCDKRVIMLFVVRVIVALLCGVDDSSFMVMGFIVLVSFFVMLCYASLYDRLIGKTKHFRTKPSYY